MASWFKTADKITEKANYFEIQITNKTAHSLTFFSSDFASEDHCGRWWEQPNTQIKSEHREDMAICNRDMAIMIGVSMSATWKIGDSGYYLGIGLENPFRGSYKTQCAISKDSQIGKQCYTAMFKDTNDSGGKAEIGSYAVEWRRKDKTIIITVSQTDEYDEKLQQIIPLKPVKKWSLLSICCPGSVKQTHGVARRIALRTTTKSGTKIHLAEKMIGSSLRLTRDKIHLGGCDRDNDAIINWLKAVCGRQHQNIESFKSDQSIVDAQISVADAKDRIKKWLSYDDGQTMHVFYFSGHGTDYEGGGICLKGESKLADMTLFYKDLMSYFKHKRAMIIIDACHAGCIVDAYTDHLEEIGVFYACAKDQFACDSGLKGGWFTKKYFSKNMLKLDEFVTGNIKEVEHTYQDKYGRIKKGKQTCGTFYSSDTIKRILKKLSGKVSVPKVKKRNFKNFLDKE